MHRLKERLVARRNALGWSQVDLAAKSGVSERAIAGYESTDSQPAGRILEKLSKALSVSPAWLLGGEDVHVMKDAPAQLPESKTASPFSWMEISTLEKTLVDLSAKLTKAMPLDRKHIIGNLVDVIGELETRELSSNVNVGAARLLMKVSDGLKTDALK